MSHMGSRSGRWRLVVVGGGSAAAVQVRRGDVPPEETLVVAERLGTGMAFLGRSTLQSYAEELLVSRTPGELRAMLPTGELRPTAAEYDAYIKESLMNSGASVTLARVLDIRRDADGFVLTLRTTGGERRQVHADNVVLATGSTPRKPSAEWQSAGAITFDTVYRELSRGDIGRWAGNSVLVVGAGNSALQTAALVAPDARDVTILANSYVGMYPAESDDRFAWRAPSQLTYELVVKGNRECGRRPWRVPCVRHVVYESLDLVDDEVRWHYREASNLNQLGSRSLPGRCRHAQGRLVSNGAWQESRKRGTTTVVWAAGSTPVYPPGELLTAMRRNPDGTLPHDRLGQTDVPGLYVTGACAGQRSVNETEPARTKPTACVLGVREPDHVEQLSVTADV